MLNGATTKLRSAQARKASANEEAHQAPGALPAFGFGGWPCGEGHWERIARACFRALAARVKPGWQLPAARIMCRGQWPSISSNPRSEAARRAVRRRARPAEPAELRSCRHLFRLVEDPSRRRRHRKLCRPRRTDGVRRARATPSSPAGSSTRAKDGRRPMSPSAAAASPDDVELAAARRQRMRALVDAIEAGAFGDVTGVLHIGIGGSVLGPGPAGRRARPAQRIDQRPLPVEHRRRGVRRSREPLDPATTLVVVASKTFSTAGDAGQHGRRARPGCGQRA